MAYRPTSAAELRASPQLIYISNRLHLELQRGLAHAATLPFSVLRIVLAFATGK
jgi:hypothetical protein